MGSSGTLISVHPEELTFQVELEKQSYCELKVVNNTEHHVAFKVKTTSPKKYFVRPNTGIVQPWDSSVVKVTLQVQREYPPDMQCKDKFLLLSTKVPPTTHLNEITQDTFNRDGEKVVEECRLRVVYKIASESGHGSSGTSFMEPSEQKSPKQISETASMHSSSSFDNVFRVCEVCPFREAHAVKFLSKTTTLMHLKEERDSALLQNQKLQQELELLKRHRDRKQDAGYSLIFAAFVGVLGVMFGFLLNLALSTPPTE